MKRARGYIFSRSFMGERAPQHVQNIVIRDFCKKKSLSYLLSSTEYRMKNSFLILKDIVSKLKDYDGIVAYSLFQMPSNYDERNKILKKIINNKKFIFFAVEQIEVFNQSHLDKINSIWEIKKTLPDCLEKI